MALFWEGVAAFLEAVGIAAVLCAEAASVEVREGVSPLDFMLCVLRPKRGGGTAVFVPLTGDAAELDRLLRRLEGLSVVLVDEGLSDEGRTRAEQAARRDPNITLKKRGETHGGTRYH